MLYNVYCDETCHLEHDNSNVMVLGAVWCPQSKLKEINERIRQIKKRNNVSETMEMKWTKISPAKVDLYKDLVNYFFDDDDLHFRGVIIPDKTRLNHERYHQTHDTWYYKMYYYLLDRFIDANYSYYILYDEKDKYTTYRMNTVKKIIENKKSFNKFSSFNLRTKQINSKESELMQLLDVIMGAVGYKNRGYMEKDKQTGQTKKEIAKYLESKFEKNIENGTSPYETKFNIFIWKPKKEVKYD